MRRLSGKPRYKIRRSGGPSPLTSVIIGFGVIIWFAQFVPTTIYSDCAYAAYWVTGWFEFKSLFQWAGLALGLIAVLWLAHLFIREVRRDTAEMIMQGVMIVALAVWFVSLKAYLFPFAYPGAAQYSAIVGALHRANPLLEDSDLLLTRWPEGFPPPEVEFERHPLFYPVVNKRMPEIFTSEYSPTGADYKRMQSCVAEQKRALVQYERDRQALRAYWREVDERLEPARPRDWREEVAEEGGAK